MPSITTTSAPMPAIHTLSSWQSSKGVLVQTPTLSITKQFLGLVVAPKFGVRKRSLETALDAVLRTPDFKGKAG